MFYDEAHARNIVAYWHCKDLEASHNVAVHGFNLFSE